MVSKLNKIILILMISFLSTSVKAKYEQLAYDFSFNDINGNLLTLSQYKNKIIIVVNVASQCGFTKQYDDMQKIWNLYNKKGVVILGVPSNDFGKQEPGTNEDIKDFCESKFGITFPMTEKVSVKGEGAHSFYQWASKNYGKSAVPKWNFHKIVIGRSGKVADTFSSITKPTSKRFVKKLESLLTSN